MHPLLVVFQQNRNFQNSKENSTALNGSVVNGTALNGCTVNGSADSGTALNGSVVNGTQVTVYRSVVARSGLHRQPHYIELPFCV